MDNQKPYVVSIGRHGCIRQQKQAIALRNHALVHSVTNKVPTFKPFFQTVMLYQNQNQLRAEIRAHEKADIFHVHTEPFWFVQLIREVLPAARIVLDLHDSQAYRFDEAEKQSAEERCAIELADAYVYVSEHCRQITEGWHPSILGRPYTILPSYVNERFFRLEPLIRVGGLVYEGRCDLRNAGEWYDYCKYQDLAAVLKEEKIPFTLYGGASDEKTQAEYKNAIYMGSLPYDQLINDMGCYDWGLCGNLVEYPEWEVAVPNKLFEYLAAGIPVIAMNAPAVAEFVEKEGVGIAVKTIRELKARWDERQRCQAEVYKKRWRWTMERNMGGLLELYGSLLRSEGKGFNGRALPHQPALARCSEVSTPSD